MHGITKLEWHSFCKYVIIVSYEYKFQHKIALRYKNCKSLYFHVQVGDKKHGGYVAEKPPRSGFPKCGNFGW